MIKELVLSLALAAASGAHFLDSPKNSIDTSNYGAPYTYEIEYTGFGAYFMGEFHYGDQHSVSLVFGTYNASEGYFDDNSSNPQIGLGPDEDYISPQGYWSLDSGYYTFTFNAYFYTDPRSNDDYNYLTSLVLSSESEYLPITDSNDWDIPDSGEEDEYIYYCFEWQVSFPSSGIEQGDKFYTGLVENAPQEFTLTKTFTNCAGYVVGSGGVLSPLPSSYTQADLQNPYTCRFYASEGYYFDNRTIAANITQSGGIVINDVVFDTPLNNDRYTTSFSCSITLPLANCSLSAVANEHTYTITSELNRCSVSGLPLSYTNELEGTYVFIAAANNGFNRNNVSYEITGATYEVSYSGILYGDFYQNLTISIQARFSDVIIRVTAVSYDPVPYQQGYQDGYGEGYAQGKIAGDSYGVWNWLKQAARTTGEFLNIPLLPGFSIGGLLTALAGLVIIWLFIKGFLFKS